MTSLRGYDAWKTSPPEPAEGCAVCDEPLTCERGEGPDHFRAKNGDFVHYACQVRHAALDESETVDRRLLSALDEAAGDLLVSATLGDGVVARGTLVDGGHFGDGSRKPFVVEDALGDEHVFTADDVVSLEVVAA